MGELARVFIFIGAILVAVGLVLMVIHKLPFGGKLPGDILVQKEHFTFYFPLATSIVVSIIISLVLYLVNKFR
jgi:hypothetical protein